MHGNQDRFCRIGAHPIMNIKGVLYLISYLLMVIGLSMAATFAVSVYYQDPIACRRALAYSGMAVLILGFVLSLFTRGPVDLSRRDGFAIVAFGWLFASLFGALPYIVSGVIPNPVSAVFETMSGFTTTGASVLSGVELLPKGILFWRALTHFFGGMGVLVLCIAILPFLGVGGMQLYRAEMPGPSKDRLTPRIENTAKLLWGVYLVLCVLEALLLKVGGMPWFDAWCNSFGTVATGGFSNYDASIGIYNNLYFEIVILVFMFLAGANFALHYRAIKGEVSAFHRDPEFLAYLGIWLFCCLAITLNTWQTVFPSFWHAARASFFTGTSIMTTTGFVTADFEKWPALSKIILVLMMFFGGCAGSTAGGIKIIRIFVLVRTGLREMILYLQPQAVIPVKVGKKPLEAVIVSHIAAFFVTYVLIFVVASALMTLFTPDLETAITSVATTLNNVGPGLGAVGPMDNFACIPTAGKAILTLCMLLGRLELYTVLVLLLPSFWRK